MLWVEGLALNQKMLRQTLAAIKPPAKSSYYGLWPLGGLQGSAKLNSCPTFYQIK
jgi:hypothetical protein